MSAWKTYLKDGSCPCKDCQKRHPACHDKCEMYKAWKAPQDEAREAKHLKESNDYYYQGRGLK